MPSELTERQQQVLALVQCNPTATLEEIGQQLGITRERVRQLCAKLTARGLLLPRTELRLNELRRRRAVLSTKIARSRWMLRQMKRQRRRYLLRERAHLSLDGMTSTYVMPGPETVCMFEGCARPVRARGYCAMHYNILRHSGAMWVQRRGRTFCAECSEPVYARGLCQRHYRFHREHGTLPTRFVAPGANNEHGSSVGYPRVVQERGAWTLYYKADDGTIAQRRFASEDAAKIIARGMKR